MVAIGYAGSKLLYVSFSERNGRSRIISARKATSHERRLYANENAH
jgi:uncharacterized DUF497 family protein